MEYTPETELPIVKLPTAKLPIVMEDSSEAPTNRVYVRVGAYSRSPSKLSEIRDTVLKGAGKVSKALARICGTEVVDLAVVYCAGGEHSHHTVRVASRDGPKFSATLHVDEDGNVIDRWGKKTRKPFKNGGKKDEGSCDFDRALFQVI